MGLYDDVDFIHREHDLIAAAEARGLPMMGVCFGSQILASALCGRDQVFRRDFCEIGYKDLYLHPCAHDDLVMRGVAGDTLRMFIWHNDEVRGDHPDMRLLASSDLLPQPDLAVSRSPDLGHPGPPRKSPLQSLRNGSNRTVPGLEQDGADISELKREARETERARSLLSSFAEIVRARFEAALPVGMRAAEIVICGRLRFLEGPS